MDRLNSLIATLSSAEKTDFRKYLTRTGKNTLESKLFDILSLPRIPDARSIAGEFYTPVNMNAYHSLRKRLMQQLYSYIVMMRANNETQSNADVAGMVSMGQFMLERNANSEAAAYLLKAEQVARENHQYAALEGIYRLLVSNAHRLSLSLQEYSKKWNENEQHYTTFRKLTMASASMLAQIEQSRVDGTPLDPQLLIDEVMEDINFTKVEANNPAFLNTIINLARSAFASTKEFHKLEPFVIRIYNRLKANDAFGPGDIDYELSFLFMIAHTLYRNKKFDLALEWTEKLGTLMPMQGFRSNALYPKYISLQAAIACYTGNNDKAISIMEGALNSKPQIPEVRERFNIQLNLAVYYFNAGEYKKANKMLLALSHSDKWFEQRMGKEWRFKKNMIELIVQYELGNIDVASNMLQRMNKYFAPFLKHPSYRSAGLFMKFTAKLISHPELIKADEFKTQVQENKLGMEDMKSDIQAVTFYCWLRSKALNRPYYEVLLERIITG